MERVLSKMRHGRQVVRGSGEIMGACVSGTGEGQDIEPSQAAFVQEGKKNQG